MTKVKKVKAASALSLMVGVGMIATAATNGVSKQMAPVMLTGVLLSLFGFVAFVACRMFE